MLRLPSPYLKSLHPLLPLLVAAAALAIPVASAATYYVSPKGNDAAPGTLQRPWRTLQKAANTLAPGDTALVRGGVYRETVTLNVSGQPGKPITLAAYPKERPILDGTGLARYHSPATAFFLLENRSHVVLRGFEMRNLKTTNTNVLVAGVFLTGASSNITVRDCSIHDLANTGGSPNAAGSAFAIAVYGTSTTPSENVRILNNTIFNCKTGWSETVAINGNVRAFEVSYNQIRNCNNIGMDFIGFEGTCPDPAQDQARDGVCRGNLIENISTRGNPAYPSGDYSAAAIYADGATRILIENNICRSNDIGIELASEHPGRASTFLTVRGNRVTGNRQAGLLLGGFAREGTGGTEDCLIENNTFQNNDTLGWESGEIQLRYRTVRCELRGNTVRPGRRGWFVTVPVGASDHAGTVLDGNTYEGSGRGETSRWVWNGTPCTGFTQWQTASGQDSTSRFRSLLPQ